MNQKLEMIKYYVWCFDTKVYIILGHNNSGS